MSADIVEKPQRAAPFSFENELPLHTWFEAPTAAGALRLRITGAVRHAADAAIVLQRCGELIDALEDWTATPLAWRWISSVSSSSAESHGCAIWRFEGDGEAARRPGLLPADPGWQIELPWTLLRALSAPTNSLVQRLCWPQVPAILATAQVRLSEDELQMLESGGAFILPDATRETWRGLLRAAEEPAHAGWGMPVALGTPLAARRVASGPCQELQGTEGDTGVWCEVRFDSLRAVAGDCLAGWFDGDLGAIATRASLWRCATDLEPARPLATGVLMPWAEGWALLLEVVCETPRPTAGVRGEPQVPLPA